MYKVYFSLRRSSYPYSSTNVLASERHWKLLSQVLHDKQSRTWLNPILGRIAIAPIVSASLEVWSQTRSLNAPAYAFACIAILYPLGTQKSTTEAILEPWGTFLKSFHYSEDRHSVSNIGLVLTQTYAESLANSSSRKKVR